VIANNPPMTPAAAVAALFFDSITLGDVVWFGLPHTLVGLVGLEVISFVVVSSKMVPVGPGDEVVDDPIAFTQYPGEFCRRLVVKPLRPASEVVDQCPVLATNIVS